MDTPVAQEQLPQPTKPKYFHQLQPQPLALPEIICNIRSHLTIPDLKKCTLVSYIWAQHFGPFLWETLYYNRTAQELDPGLQRNGPLVRYLITFSLHDKDLRMIARDCPNLTGLELEIDNLKNTTVLYQLLHSVKGLQRLTLRLPNPNDLSMRQRALLEPIAHGALEQLTELRLMGFDNRRYAPVYQARTVLRCMEACPSLRILELNSIRLVDTAEQWNDTAMNSFSSPNSVPVRKHQSGSFFSWLSWGQPPPPPPPPINTTPQDPTSPDEDLDQRPPSPSPCLRLMDSLSKDRNVEVPMPKKDFKSKSLTAMVLKNVFVSSQGGHAFVTSLLTRAPNLTHLTLKSTPADVVDLDQLCPKLKTVNFDDFYSMNYSPQPAIERYLSSSLVVGDGGSKAVESKLLGLTSLRLNRCRATDDLLRRIQDDFVQYRLKHLEITSASVTSFGLATFLARCCSLETVWVDHLMAPLYQRTLPARDRSRRAVGTTPVNSVASTSNVNTSANAIRWECTQIRYLDVLGQGDKRSFDTIFLDLVVRLDKLDFLGMGSHHILWLMECEPLQYAKQNDTTATDSQTLDSKEEEEEEPLPLGLFGSVKTLALETTCRQAAYYPTSAFGSDLKLEHAKYLYHAFPALEKIVYSCSFPFKVEAQEWLLNTPRRIAIVHRPKNEAHAVAINI